MDTRTLHSDGTRTLALTGTTLAIRNELAGRTVEVYGLDAAAIGEVPAAMAGKVPNPGEMRAVLTGGQVRAVIPAALVEVVERGITEAKASAERSRQAAVQNVKCERCGVGVDAGVAYSQRERMQFGGAFVPVTAYYCEECARLLQQVGAGERSAMQKRGAGEGREPEHKGDL